MPAKKTSKSTKPTTKASNKIDIPIKSPPKPVGYRPSRMAADITDAKEFDNAATKTKGGGFDDVAGMEDLKEMLRRDVIDALRQRDRYREYGLTIPNGLLLYGPPGCGKSFIAERFAEEVGCKVISVTRSDVASIYVDGTVERIRALFDIARRQAPCALLFDEFDAFVPNRDYSIQHAYRSEVNEFLTQLQGISAFDVIVLATTNSPELIDPAVLRSGRIDKLVYVAPPDVQAREEMFRIHLRSRPMGDGIDLARLATLTESFVASDIKLIVDDAARVALYDDTKISEEILKEIISNSKPSISAEQQSRYKQLQTNFSENGSEGERNPTRRLVGFRRPCTLIARG